jgi:hypothetical protein
MTKRRKIANGYKDRHTREGGYPDIRTTFYEFHNKKKCYFSFKKISASSAISAVG